MTDRQDARWQEELEARGWVEFPPDRDATSKLLATGVFFVGLGVYFVATETGFLRFVGAIAVVFFGSAAVAILITRRNGRSTVRVDTTGICSAGQHVAWAEIVEITTRTIGIGPSKTLVTVMVTEAAAVRLRSDENWLRRAVEPLNRTIIGGPSLQLPGTNGYQPAAMAAWLNHLWSTYRP